MQGHRLGPKARVTSWDQPRPTVYVWWLSVLVYFWDSWEWERDLFVMLWLAFANLFLMLDCLASLIQGEGLSPPSACFAMFCWHQWKTCTFLNRSGGRVDWGRGQRGGERRKGEEGGKESCYWNNLINKLKKCAERPFFFPSFFPSFFLPFPSLPTFLHPSFTKEG